MPWEVRRNGHRYFYRRERRDGRSVGRYVGAGALGDLHAMEVELGRLERARDRALLREAEEAGRALDAAIRPLHEAADAALKEFMHAAGFRRHHRGEWRRRKAMTSSTCDLVEAANAGDHAALDRLADVLETDVGVADRYGDIEAAARRALLDHLADGRGTQAALLRKMERIAADLAGPDATPIERLVAGRAALDWALLYRAEMDWDESDSSIPLANYRAGRLDRLHRKYLRSLRTLADVRQVCTRIRIGRVDVRVGNPAPAAINGTCKRVEATS